MILHTETVEQAIEGDERAEFVKDVVAAREGEHPIAMVRKRRKDGESRGAVVLVHGFGQNRYTWHSSQRSFANYLANEGWDVFNVDLRGRGRSKQYGSPRPTNLDDYIRQDVPTCVGTAARLSGFDKVFLVGHSMGGLISYSVAGRMRDQVAGVVTIGSPYRFGRGSLFLRTAAPLLYGARLTGAFDGNPPLPVRWMGQYLGRFYDLRLLPLPMRPWAPGSIEPDLLDEYLSCAFEHTRMSVALGIVRNGAEGGLQSDDGLMDYGTAFELADLPVLVIAGTKDALAPPESVKPAYDRSRSADRTYRVFPQGHVDMIMGRDAPFSVWRLIRTWLGARERHGVLH